MERTRRHTNISRDVLHRDAPAPACLDRLVRRGGGRQGDSAWEDEFQERHLPCMNNSLEHVYAQVHHSEVEDGN